MKTKRTPGLTDYTYGKLTDAQMNELTAWFISFNNCKTPEDVLPIPEFYRPTIAFLQLKSLDIVTDEDDMYPWNMHPGIVDYYADVWLANRRAVIAIAAQQIEQDQTQRASVIGEYLFGQTKEPGRA